MSTPRSSISSLSEDGDWHPTSTSAEPTCQTAAVGKSESDQFGASETEGLVPALTMSALELDKDGIREEATQFSINEYAIEWIDSADGVRRDIKITNPRLAMSAPKRYEKFFRDLRASGATSREIWVTIVGVSDDQTFSKLRYDASIQTGEEYVSTLKEETSKVLQRVGDTNWRTFNKMWLRVGNSAVLDIENELDMINQKLTGRSISCYTWLFHPRYGSRQLDLDDRKQSLEQQHKRMMENMEKLRKNLEDDRADQLTKAERLLNDVGCKQWRNEQMMEQDRDVLLSGDGEQLSRLVRLDGVLRKLQEVLEKAIGDIYSLP